MRRRAPITIYGVALTAGTLIIAGLAAIPAGAAIAPADSGSSSPSGSYSASMPITGYYQMAVDSADSRVFISQGTSGGDSIVVTDFSGNVIGSIAEPSPVEGIALSPDGDTLYAAVVGSTTVSPAISVISTASLTQTTSYPLAAADTPQDVAVQSGKLWVSYGSVHSGTAGIGDFDLSAASPTLETQPAMGGWYSPPMLAADPTGDGNVLVAVDQNVLDPTATTYDTADTPATIKSQGALSHCTGDEYDYAIDLAVVPGGAGFIVACDTPTNEFEYKYSTSGLQEQESYPGYGRANAIALAASTGLVAVGAMDTSAIVAVYTASGIQTNHYQAVGGTFWPLADRGLGLNADGSELFAMTADVVYGVMEYTLDVYQGPDILSAVVTLAQPAGGAVATHPLTITGTLTVDGAAASGVSVDLTRTGDGQPSATFEATVRAGQFTWIDYPPAGGTYTYTATDPIAGAASPFASVTVSVARATASLPFTATPATASYGAAVKYSATVKLPTASAPTSTLTVYAQQAGQAKVKVASVTNDGVQFLNGTEHFDRSTTLTAVYSGNAVYAPLTVTKTVGVGANVSEAIGGYYGTKSGDRLYHHTARVAVSTTVAPLKKGECVQFQVQKDVKGAWQAVTTTGCVALNAKSQATYGLVVTKYALGVPYRVRVDYIRGNDTSNLDADSGFLGFMVEP